MINVANILLDPQNENEWEASNDQVKDYYFLYYRSLRLKSLISYFPINTNDIHMHFYSVK